VEFGAPLQVRQVKMKLVAAAALALMLPWESTFECGLGLRRPDRLESGLEIILCGIYILS
jgi:hypothetical protein